MLEALAALEKLSRSGARQQWVALVELQSRKRTHIRPWVETGEVADALGVSVAEAAAALRAGSRLGLCSRRRSLLHGTVWRPALTLAPDSCLIES
jgi:hypothetical protein